MSRGPAVVRQLLRALGASAQAAGCNPALAHMGETAWATATFTGARHRLTATGEPAAMAEWLATLPEAELPLTGWFIASCAAAVAGSGATIELLVIQQ